MKSIFRLSAWLPAIFALGVAHAQTPANDPSDPSIHASLPAYRSAFDGYRKASESVQHSANETAGTQHTAQTGMHHQQAMQMSGEHVGHSMQMHSAHHHMEEEMQ